MPKESDQEFIDSDYEFIFINNTHKTRKETSNSKTTDSSLHKNCENLQNFTEIYPLKICEYTHK